MNKLDQLADIEGMTLDELFEAPIVGDRVRATRRTRSNIYHNTVVGPVVDTWYNACRILCNEGTDIETDFQLFFSDWTFEKLF